MLTPVRALAAACLILLAALGHLSATPAPPDTAVLEFLGFRAGARLDELALHLGKSGGGKLRCRRSKMDPRVSECRGALREQQLGGAIDVWVSAIDSIAGVITVSGVVAPGQIERWSESLQAQYGPVGTNSQGAQRMRQWVRRGRMLRLTWRTERGEKVASISLVDGRVLDGWGRGIPATDKRQPTSRTR
jgi:hypothetical protein